MHTYIYTCTYTGIRTYIYIGMEVITFFSFSVCIFFPSFKNRSMDTKAPPKRPHIGHLGPRLGPLGPHLGHLRPCHGHLGPHWGHLPPQSMQAPCPSKPFGKKMCGAGVYACVFNPAPHPLWVGRNVSNLVIQWSKVLSFGIWSF